MNQTLDQIQVDFVPNEDRLLLKLRAGHSLYRAWLTRRFLKLWVPILQGVHPQTGERFAEAPALPPEQADAIAPQKEAPLEERAETFDHPLGETPILAVEISYNAPQEDAAASMVIKPAQGPGIVLPYQPALNLSLLKLLRQSARQADWELDALFHETAAPASGRLQ